jgi:mxaJ protein
MCSPSRASLAILGVLAAAPAGARELRVCGEPDNLPFSNRAGEGFENRIAAILARDLGAEPVLVPIAQRGPGFLRNTLGAGRCDAIMGQPEGAEGAALTRPYYRTGWMFITRADAAAPRSFDDPALAGRTVGVPVVGGVGTPPLLALERRGLAGQVRPYPLADSPPARIVSDLAQGRLDIGVLWGPQAGFYAAREAAALRLTPTPPDDGPGMPLVLGISVAVARNNAALRDELDAALERQRSAIGAVLAEYNIPRRED